MIANYVVPGELLTGSLLRGEPNLVQATLGPIARDRRTGGLVALTGSLLLTETGGGLVSATLGVGSEVVLGVTRPASPQSREVRPHSIADRVGLVDLIDQGIAFEGSGSVVDPLAALGCDVVKVGGRCQSGTGIVVAVSSVAELQDLGMFVDVMEIETASGVPFAGDGDGGAVVRTLDGGIVGLVVGVSGGVTLVAPINAVLERHDLELAMPGRPTVTGTDDELMRRRELLGHRTGLFASYWSMADSHLRDLYSPLGHHALRSLAWARHHPGDLGTAHLNWGNVRSSGDKVSATLDGDRSVASLEVYILGLANVLRTARVDPGKVPKLIQLELNRSSGRSRSQWRSSLSALKHVLAVKPVALDKAREALFVVSALHGESGPLLDEHGLASLDSVRLEPPIYVLAEDGRRIAHETLHATDRLAQMEAEFRKFATPGTAFELDFPGLLSEMIAGRSVIRETASAVDLFFRAGGYVGGETVTITVSDRMWHVRPAYTERVMLKLEHGAPGARQQARRTAPIAHR